VGLLKTALDIRTKAVGTLDGSLIPDLDRLANVQLTMRDYGESEATYRHALVIRETILGKEDADLITSVDGLAYSCFGLQKYEEAEALYKRLIDLWVKSVQEDHPMVAVALDKLAAFYVDRKKLDQAKELTDRAIAIRARFLALGLSLAATEQINEEHKDAAAAMYRRAVNAMDPVHPLNAQLHHDMGEMIKTMEIPPPKPTAKTPQRKK
jgi:tetratricopeptide (TPR) repeat protein